MQRVLLGSAALIVAVSWGAPAPAGACGHAMMEVVEHDPITDVDRAERLLSLGQAVQAFRVARRARLELERELRSGSRDATTVRVHDRAKRVIAIAVVRLDGRAPLGARETRRTIARGREMRALRWALGHLRAVARADPNDLRAQVHYAEALARIPEHRDEARRLLGRLAAQDLMADPHGYAALVLVTDPQDDRAGWERAVARCQQMAGEHVAAICPSLSVPRS